MAFELLLDKNSEILQTMKELDAYYEKQAWDEENVTQYLNELLEKHGPAVQKKLEISIKQDVSDFSIAQQESLQPQLEHRWIVGEPSLKKLDKPLFESMVTKIKQIWPASSSQLLDGWEFQDLGIYFLSINNTNIFD